MKQRLLLLGIACLYVLLLPAQSRVGRGQTAFNSGDYNEAITQWEAAAVVDPSVSGQTDALIKKAKRCLQLLVSGESGLQAGQYELAENAYSELKRLNPNDGRAAQGLKRCQEGKERVRQAKAAKKLWESVRLSDKKSDYEQFLKQYPQSEYEQEARKRIGEIEDTEFWRQTERLGTEQAYRDYLKKSAVGTYKTEAMNALAAIEDNRAWESARTADTRAHYEAYLKRYSKHATEARLALKRLKQLDFLERAEGYLSRSQVYLASKEIERVDSLGVIPTELADRYHAVSEKVLFQKCMDNKKYHSLGREDCERYLSLYGDSDKSRVRKVQGRLNRHNRLYGKDYDQVLNLGVSLLDIGGGNGGMLYMGPRVALRVGSWDFPVSFSVAVAAYYHTGDLDTGNVYELGCWQTPVQGRLRINLFGSDKLKWYVAGGASYNLNYGVKNTKKNRIEEISSKVIHSTNSSAFGEIGVSGEKFEVAFFYSKDLQPFFNKEYIMQNVSNYSKLWKFDQRFGVHWAYFFHL